MVEECRLATCEVGGKENGVERGTPVEYSCHQVDSIDIALREGVVLQLLVLEEKVATVGGGRFLLVGGEANEVIDRRVRWVMMLPNMDLLQSSKEVLETVLRCVGDQMEPLCKEPAGG